MPIGSDKGNFIKPGFDPLAVQTSVTSYSLYAWGYGAQGQLGLGNTAAQSTPIQVGALTTWTQVATGRQHTLAIESGKLYAMGNNNYGNLGDGTTVAKSSPIQVGALTNWSKVAATQQWASLALKTDGTLWSFGYGASGQLAQGNLTNYSSPVQIGALTDWGDAEISGGNNFFAAIKTDGTFWAWGDNSYGQLGLGNQTSRSSPVQVGALTTWSKVSTGGYGLMAVKTDGTLWGWGYNGSGQLGVGSGVAEKSSPVQVGSLTTWLNVSSGRYYTTALTTDGKLYAWGQGNSGQIGQGNTTDYNSPVQVGALTTWSKIGGGADHSLAIKTDGTLWAWGNNAYSQLGNGDAIGNNKSSPIQIGSLTTWAVVAGSGFSQGSFALII